MSHHHQDAKRPPSLTPAVSLQNALENLDYLGVKMQETARELLTFYEQNPQLQSWSEVEARAPNASAPDRADARQIREGETRSYYFPPSALRHERKLLEKYHATDFCGLIAETNGLLFGLVKVMKSVHPDTRLRGSSIASLGNLLEHVATMTLRMKNVYSQITKV